MNTYAYALNNPISFVDPTGLDWVYSQSTGALLTHVDANNTSTLVGTGYAGHGEGVNNPNMQNVANTGPVPRGTYRVGAQEDIPREGRRTLHGALRLYPDATNNMNGRAGFLMHRGDMNARDSSEGCIIQTPQVLDTVGASNDHVLRVVQ